MPNVYQLIGSLLPYAAFTASAPEIPQLYWDVESQEQRIKNICCELKKLVEYVESMQVFSNETADAVRELQVLFEKFQASGFEDYYETQIKAWIESNLPWLWKTFASQVYFGLTSDGHFVAYVPESWADIQFDTGAVYGTEPYGRLILRLDVSGPAPGIIDNTAPDYASVEGL